MEQKLEKEPNNLKKYQTSSPRDNGSTVYIVDKIIEGMKDSGIKTKIYCLDKQTIK